MFDPYGRAMFPSTNPPFRYVQAARRSRALHLVATGALVLLPAACGDGDADVFGDDAGSDAVDEQSASDATTDGSITTTSRVADDPPPATATASAGTSIASDGAASGGVVPVGGELVVDFTYSSGSSQGPVRNPYIAVWVEDGDGNLVQTVSLWYEQSGKGARWLNELRNWYSVGAGDTVTSGATRAAGTYSVVWDGTGLDGQPVPAGDYVLFIEAAREHGPYSITSAPITVDGSSFQVALADDGELSAATATMAA
jgi:hypothetical protein